jgi:hypothetical protein
MATTHREMTSLGTTDARPILRLADETKPSLKTTEMYAFVAAVVGVLLATQQLDNMDGWDGWRLVTALTIGYMVSRGLAKAGSGHAGGDR